MLLIGRVSKWKKNIFLFLESNEKPVSSSTMNAQLFNSTQLNSAELIEEVWRLIFSIFIFLIESFLFVMASRLEYE